MTNSNKTTFMGWRFGAGLDADVAETLDAHVDVLENLLPFISLNLRQHTAERGAHSNTLHLTYLVGKTAERILDIDAALAEERSPEERLALLNSKALAIRQNLQHIAALAAVMIVALDNSLDTGAEDNGDSRTND